MRIFRRTRETHSEEPAGENRQYEVAEFALKHGLSIFESRRILREAGTSREQADAAAEASKARAIE